MKIILNHKSHFIKEEVLDYIKAYETLDTNHHEVFLCPSSCYLSLFEGYPLVSQDISRFPLGPFTGEISGSALRSLGVVYVLIHHMEREEYLREDLSVSKEKLKQATSSGLIPIICVGETQLERKSGDYLCKIKQTLDYLLEGISLDSYLIGYEPYYAIGTNQIPSESDLREVVSMLKEQYHCPILYGGSVNLENLETLKKIESFDGFLLGSISLKIEQLQELLLNL